MQSTWIPEYLTLQASRAPFYKVKTLTCVEWIRYFKTRKVQRTNIISNYQYIYISRPRKIGYTIWKRERNALYSCYQATYRPIHKGKWPYDNEPMCSHINHIAIRIQSFTGGHYAYKSLDDSPDYQTKRRSISENSHLHTARRDSLNSHTHTSYDSCTMFALCNVFRHLLR